MQHPLEDTLSRFRRHLRVVLALEGLLRMMASVVGAVLLLALLDYTLHVHNTGIRILLSLLAVGVLVMSTWRFLIRPWTDRLRTIELARAIEAEYPPLGSRLSSAIDFLGHPESDVLAGSVALRGSVIDRTRGELAAFDLHDLLDIRRVSTAALLALTLCLTAAGLVLVDPPAARIALTRLIWPLGDARWSREALSLSTTPIDVQQLDVSLTPPPGTEIPPRKSGPRICAVRGTRAVFSGTFTRPVRRAVLHRGAGRAIAAELSDDGRHFRTASDDFVIRARENYWFEVDDPSGTHRIARPAWRVSVVHDPAPTVRFERPTTDVWLTPRAKLAIAIRAADNLPVPHLAVVYTRSDRDACEERAVTGLADLEAADVATAPPAARAESIRRVGTVYDLSSLAVQPGARIELTARARDRLNQRAEAVRRVRIVSDAVWRAAATSWLQDLAARLARIITLQRTVRRHVGTLETSLHGTAAATRRTLDHLRSLPIEQHQVRQMLLAPPHGILARIDQQLRAWTASGVEPAGQVAGLQHAADRLDALERKRLAPIRRALSAAVKTADAAEAWPPRAALATGIASALGKAGDDQDLLLEALADIAKRLSRHASSGALVEDLHEIRDAQQRILQATRRQLRDALADADAAARFRPDALRTALSEQQIDLAVNAEHLAASSNEPSGELDRLGMQMRRAARAIDQDHLGRAVQQQEKIAQQLDELAKQDEGTDNRESPSSSAKSLQDTLTRLVATQRGLEKQTSALDASRHPSHPRTRTDLRNIAEVQKREAALRGKTARIASSPTAAAAAVGALLTGAATAMQQSVTQLGNRRTGKGTQQAMAAAREHLEQARTKLANQPAAGTARQGPSPQSPRRTTHRTARAGAAQAAGDGQPSGRAGGQHATPSERVVALRAEGNARTWVKQVWGHLPEHMRQPLMQSADDQFLPKYQVPLEAYFRRLSEEPLNQWDNRP